MRIAIVNSVSQTVEALRRVLAAAGRQQIAWVAADGLEAVSLCSKDRPDLILMDLVMPRMDGVEATRRIMAETPCPILIVTASVSDHPARVFEALGAGALDAVNAPLHGLSEGDGGVRLLLSKVATVAKLSRGGAETAPARRIPTVISPPARASDFVAIGCSAGGPLALATVLSSIPKDFAAPIVVIQHLDSEFAPGLATWLAGQCSFPVRLAQEGDVLKPGVVFLAGMAEHLVFVRPGVLGYTTEPKTCPYRPSVDVFFESAVRVRSGRVVGVLLTGMGRDGAQGLKALRDAGEHTIAQDQGTCAVYGMPKAAAALGAAVEILPLARIGPAIVKQLSASKSG